MNQMMGPWHAQYLSASTLALDFQATRMKTKYMWFMLASLRYFVTADRVNSDRVIVQTYVFDRATEEKFNPRGHFPKSCRGLFLHVFFLLAHLSDLLGQTVTLSSYFQLSWYLDTGIMEDGPASYCLIPGWDLLLCSAIMDSNML